MKIDDVIPLDDETVQLADQIGGFRRVLVRAHDDEGRRVEVTAEAQEQGYECTAIAIESRGAAISSELLRRIPVAALVREAAQFVAYRGSPDEPIWPAFPHNNPRWPSFVMREWPHGNLDEVAEWTAQTYALAAYRGTGPTKAVREAAGVSQATAGKLIRSARDRGILTTPAPRQSGGARAHLSRASHGDA